jgi:diguanylate cyclase
MSIKPENTPQNPADIAREAFRQLATRRIAPTPDAYRDIYEGITGTRMPSPPEIVLTEFATKLAAVPGGVTDLARRLNLAVQEDNWQEYGKNLFQLIEKHLRHAIPAPIPVAIPAAPPLKSHSSLVEDLQINLLRDLLARTLTLAVSSLLQGSPELAMESETLGLSIKNATSEAALNDIGVRLKQLCFKIELKSGDSAEEHELLLRLFRLLLENISELLDEGSWLNGQIAAIQDLLSGTINHGALTEATRSLKEVIYKQSLLKHSLTEAKVTVKNMMITFIDHLSIVAATTEDYHQKIDLYSQKISRAQNIGELDKILEDVMRETRVTQTEALRSRDNMIAARQEVQEAESRIKTLESKLEQMSELVREDQLTGSLNRRGLDDVFEREMARAIRRKSPLCIAMLDLDDFKRLNDTHGHLAGDEALIHLVRVIKNTLRTMDVIARFGGEEFLILLPDTSLEAAAQTITRLQRELTKRIFMHNDKHLLITFSAGVALLAQDETQAAIVARADHALYQAKKAGKNRVVIAK